FSPSLRPPPPPTAPLVPYTTLFRSCRSSGGSSGTSPGSRARWSGDPQARAAVAIGGGACPRRSRADRGSGIADRDQHHRVTRGRSEEHTSELQSPDHLVCRLLLEKK